MPSAKADSVGSTYGYPALRAGLSHAAATRLEIRFVPPLVDNTEFRNRLEVDREGVLTFVQKVKIPVSIAANPCPAGLSALCSTQLGVRIHQEIMQRLTAGFLLLFAIVGTILPAALQATATPEHACCRRQAGHHCHETGATNPQEPVVRGVGCCHGDCSRTVTTARWAHPQPQTGASSSELSRQVSLDTHDSAVCARFLASLSTRAPPLVSIA